MICSSASSYDASDYARKTLLYSSQSITRDVVHPFPSSCTKIYARHERDSRGAEHAWLSWPGAKVSNQVHQWYPSTAPHRRPPAITRGDSDNNCDDHDEETRQHRRRELAHCIRRTCRLFLLYPLDEGVAERANDNRARRKASSREY